MSVNNPKVNSLLADGQVDLREVLAALQRRWIWVASGGLLGIAIAIFSSFLVSAENPSKKSIRMVVDVAQSPYRVPMDFANRGMLPDISIGELNTSKYRLKRLASKEFASDKTVSFTVKPLLWEDGRLQYENSISQAVLEVSFNSSDLTGVRDKLLEIKRDFFDDQFSDMQRLPANLETQSSQGWISIEDDQDIVSKPNFYRSWTGGLLGGLVVGSGAALIADRRSNRVFSHSKLLEQLGYPLWLTLPTLPWSDQVAGPLIGQLAARLDRSLEWRVLSIAHEHEVVAPLAQALTHQNEPELSCKSVEPLLNSIIRLGSDSRPIGLLVVVESGFNSSQALEDARLLLSQLSCVKSIGIVLAGVPLPSELVVGQKA